MSPTAKRRRIDPPAAATSANGLKAAALSPLNADDASKLLRVLESIDGHHLLDQPVGEGKATLRSQVVANSPLAELTVRVVASHAELQSFVDRLVTSRLSSPPVLPDFPFDPLEESYGRFTKKRSEVEWSYIDAIGRDRIAIAEEHDQRRDDVERWRTQVLALIRQLGDSTSAPPAERYVLHRTVQGSTELFSTPSTRRLTAEDIAEIDRLADTDLVALPTDVIDPALTAPTIGELDEGMPKLVTPALRPGSVGAPYQAPHGGQSLFSACTDLAVDFLDYDVYSSFAPSYDSSDSMLSYAASAARRLGKNRLQEHEQLPLTALDLPTASTSAIPLPASAITDLGLDADKFQTALNALTSRPIDSILAKNAARLRQLQIAQRERLRQEVGSARAGEQRQAPVTEAERVMADEAIGTLASLLPFAGSSIIPPAAELRRLHPSTDDADSRPAAFFGQLDSNSRVSVRDAALVSPAVAVLPPQLQAAPPIASGSAPRSSNTIRLPARSSQTYQPRPPASHSTRDDSPFALGSNASTEPDDSPDDGDEDWE